MTSRSDPTPTGPRPLTALGDQIRGALAHPGAAAVATIAGIINGTTMLLGAWAVGWATDHLVVPALDGGRVTASAWWISIVAILGISTIRFSTIFVRGVATGHVQFGAQARTRQQLVRSYLHADPRWHARRTPGEMLARTVGDVDAQWLPMQFAYFALGMLVMLVVALAELFWRGPGLGAVGLVMVTVVVAANLGYQRALAPRAARAQEARSAVASMAVESIEGTAVVRSLGLAAAEAERFSPTAARLRLANLEIARVQSVVDPIMELTPTAAVLGVLGLGAASVRAQTMSVGDLVGLVYLLLTVAIPLNVISRFWSMLPSSLAGGNRVRAVIHGAAPLRFGDRRLPDLGGSVRGPVEVQLEDVSVEVGDQRILGPVDAVVQPGAVTAIVGAVGAGKSTLAEVAAGQIRPTTGRVLIDGIDVSELAAGVLAQSVAVVPQSSFLFAESVRENLCLAGDPWTGRPYSDQQIWRALSTAVVDDVVTALPHGLDTVVGERGASLSGGQRQRLCLARALLRRPRLLVLDDATSALDPRVEREVLAGLSRLAASGDLTVLVVANRPATLAMADQVIFVSDGRARGLGRHSELLASDEDYRAIVTAYDPSDDTAYADVGPADLDAVR